MKEFLEHREHINNLIMASHTYNFSTRDLFHSLEELDKLIQLYIEKNSKTTKGE